MPDEDLKELVSILLPRRQTDSLDDIANHLELFWTLWKKLVGINVGSIAHGVNFPFVQHTTLTTSFDDVVNGACSLSHPFDKNTLCMRKSYEK